MTNVNWVMAFMVVIALCAMAVFAPFVLASLAG